MRLVLAIVLALGLLAFTPAVPTAQASCQPGIPGICVKCLVSAHDDPDCLVHNPCDPRNCDPYWP